MASVRARLVKLENKQRFLDWFVWDRFYDSLTLDELRSFGREGELPNPIPDRPNKLERLDLKSLLKRWEDEERNFGGRSVEELKCFAKSGFWPEQKGKIHYSMKDGKLMAEWQIASENPGPVDTPENDRKQWFKKVRDMPETETNS